MKQIFLLYLILLIKIINNDLYADTKIKYITYDAFTKNASAGDLAIGNMEGLDLQISKGIATLTTKEIWHGWHEASLG